MYILVGRRDRPETLVMYTYLYDYYSLRDTGARFDVYIQYILYIHERAINIADSIQTTHIYILYIFADNAKRLKKGINALKLFFLFVYVSRNNYKTRVYSAIIIRRYIFFIKYSKTPV